MIRTVRGAATLAGAGVAGLLIWISTQIDNSSTGGYWAVYGILAGAGLTMAVSQLAGGWTKWGRPRLSLGVFLLAFVPVLIAAGWVLLAGQPQGNWFQSHITAWSGHLGIGGLVSDLRERLGVLAFGVGLVFGLAFDTSGPVRGDVVSDAEPLPEPAAYGPDETLTAPVARPLRPFRRERRRERQPVS